MVDVRPCIRREASCSTASSTTCRTSTSGSADVREKGRESGSWTSTRCTTGRSRYTRDATACCARRTTSRGGTTRRCPSSRPTTRRCATTSSPARTRSSSAGCATAKIDGWRMDVADEIEFSDYWRTARKEIKSTNPDAVHGRRELAGRIAHAAGRPVRRRDELPVLPAAGRRLLREEDDLAPTNSCSASRTPYSQRGAVRDVQHPQLARHAALHHRRPAATGTGSALRRSSR